MKLSRQEIVFHSLAFASHLDGWNPSLKRALTGLTAEQADWTPSIGDVHSIRALVRHLIFYKKQLLDRIQGIESVDSESNQATFKGQQDSPWEQLVAELFAVQDALLEYLQQLQDEALDRPLPHVPLGGQLLTLAMHDVYHTGQMVLIRKMQGSWQGD
jgi:uncharacterized damage-inducible protein DinB